jgi:hypothetical protein
MSQIVAGSDPVACATLARLMLRLAQELDRDIWDAPELLQ